MKCKDFFGSKISEWQVSLMIDVLCISNNFLERSFVERSLSEKKLITPMKLQKLLYFTYKYYLQQTKEPLFSERFEVWAYGPVLSTVYHYFSRFKAKSINSYYLDDKKKPCKLNEQNNPAVARAIEFVWANYAEFDGSALSYFTHLAGTAWAKAKQNKQSLLDDKDIIEEKWYKYDTAR